NEKKIKAALLQFDYSRLNYSIVHTDEIVSMDDDPTAILKLKKNSSMYKGLELHAQGYTDAFISVGNTGAVLSTATVLLGRIEGVSRPTIGAFFPSMNKYPTLILDVGANIECKAKFLYEFAVMGSIYATQMLGLENPRIGLLNIGEESSKGTSVVKETYQLIKQSDLNFIGNVEGRDILQGTADIVVCDGFTGNIVLKFGEGIFSFMKSKIKEYAKKNIFNTILVGLLSAPLKGIFKGFNYEQYGGVPLLGVNGVVLIGHGKSSAAAIENIILKAVSLIENDVNNKIELALNPPIVSETKE
ncbi:MAG: Phosphate acyltransferase, partial [Bacteroidota bacterium]|nr:Phosphate acyltransferase [Bacteroidota bacterium]